MRLAATELFRAKWTNQIHDEWIRNLLRSRPDLTRGKLERVRMLMDQNTLDCIVSDYEHLIQELKLPDPDDRHVLAAAIQSKASMIVTFNLKDFPASSLEQYQIEACSPDDFIQMLAEIDLDKVLATVKIAMASLKKPPVSLEEYLVILSKHRLPKTVALLDMHQELL